MADLGSFLGGFSGSTIGSAVVKLYTDADAYNAGLAKANANLTASTSSMGSALTKFKAAGALAFAAFGVTAVKFIGDAVAAASEAEKVFAQTEAVVASTGGAAGLSADQMAALAEALQRTTTFADEAVLGMENVLATFKNIQGPEFAGAVTAVLDMSTALEKDLKSSAIQVGKALNDPITGLTALRRAGVSFTDSQVELIKRLTESGDVMKAQRIILEELNEEFGGSAAAAADTYAGKVAQLANQWDEFKEKVGGDVIPILSSLLDGLQEGSDRIGYMIRATKALGDGQSLMATEVVGSTSSVEELNAVIDRARKSFEYTHQTVERFARLTGKDLKEWRGTVTESFRDAFGSVTDFDDAFTVTAREFRRNALRMAEQASTFTRDLERFQKLDISEPIRKALLEEGVPAVHAFVEANKGARRDIIQALKDTQGEFATQTQILGEMTGKLNDLDGKKAQAYVDIQYSVSGINIETLMQLPGFDEVN